MIGYLLQQALRNAAPGLEVATLLTQVVVDADDPAFSHPTKPIGAVTPTSSRRSAPAAAAGRSLPMAPDMRRVVPSPVPRPLSSSSILRSLVAAGVVVVAAGGGGIPVVQDAHGSLHGVDAVIDKDLASALLANGLGADRLLLLTDVDAVHADFRGPSDRALRRASPAALRSLDLPAGSMGPKVQAAAAFAEGGGEAVIGALDRLPSLLAGTSGTTISARFHGLVPW